MIDELITTAEAARRLGVSRSRIYPLIRSGRLPAQKLGDAWLIRAADLHLVEDRPVGNPNWRKGGDSGK